MTIESLVAAYGLPAIFMGAGLEGETVAVLAGVVAHAGTLPLWQVFAAVGLGSCLADQIFFACGRFFRDAAAMRRIREKPLFAKALAAFEKRPVAFAFGFRFLYGFRTVSPVAIGTTRLPAIRFALINAAAATVWAAVFVSLGYAFGHGVEAMFGRLKAEHGLFLGLAAAALLAAGLGVWARHRRATDET